MIKCNEVFGVEGSGAEVGYEAWKSGAQEKLLWGGDIWPRSEYQEEEKLWQDLGKEHYSEMTLRQEET